MRKLQIAYFAHSVRSDWNNGNAHFLRGLLRSIQDLGHRITVFEPETAWSIENLRAEPLGDHSLIRFAERYSDLCIHTYAETDSLEIWQERLSDADAVLLHEWNPPALAHLLLQVRRAAGYKLLFHDTHHRASSSPDSFTTFGLNQFDGVLVFGEILRSIYRERFAVENVWTLHEAADTSVFHPDHDIVRRPEIVWIGNWGDGERSREIREYLLEPAGSLAPEFQTRVYGVRYPEEGLQSLRTYGVEYCGYLPNLDAPRIYASARITAHIPRQQYATAMKGIPTIRVFEALACGIPLVSAPWHDSEQLFRKGDFQMATSPADMYHLMSVLLRNPALAAEQAARGLETVLARHTCRHRAEELLGILEELSV